MKKTWVAALIAGLFSAGAFAQAKLSNEVVKIGVLTDMSGLYSDVGGEGAVIAKTKPISLQTKRANGLIRKKST